MKQWRHIILFLAVCILVPVAHAIGDERIIVLDSMLVGRDEASRDVPVNILVIDGKLIVVTKDELTVKAGDTAVDANGGFLLGNLAVGDSPSFVILDADPRENVETLLDTKKHARFAMRKGEILKNELEGVPVSLAEGEPKPSFWKAYTPPPIAVPIRYFDSRKWNKFETKPISGLFIGALILDRQYWLSQDSNSKGQVGDLSDFEGGEIRVLRFGAVGTLNFKRPWRYTVFGGTNAFDKGYDVDTADSVAMYDYRLDIPLAAKMTLSVGKQKEPISLERLMGLAYLPMQERSTIADTLLPSRSHGVVLSGEGATENVNWAAGAFNNWIDADTSFSETSNQLVGRVTWAPAVFQTESNLVHLGLGLRYSDASQSLRGLSEPEFNNAPLYVDTGSFPANDQLTYSLEAYWRNGPYMLGFEYIGADVAAPLYANPYLSGYHITGSWALTGETRGYRKRSGTFDPLPVARSVNRGGWGTVEAAFRFSSTDLTDGLIDGGEMDVWSLGLNWWLTRSMHFGLNYRYITLDRFGEQGNSSGVNARILLMLD